jgi:hypothetical protein
MYVDRCLAVHHPDDVIAGILNCRIRITTPETLCLAVLRDEPSFIQK